MPTISEPERAIRAFEALTTLRICVHDFEGTFRSWISPRYYWHGSNYCVAVKHGPFGKICAAQEGRRIGAKAHTFPDGRIHRCHAGLVEWVMPVLDGEKLLSLLYAGQRKPGRDLQLDHIQPRSGAMPDAEPASVDQQTAQVWLEALRQLAARLLLWHRRQSGLVDGNTRVQRIRHFIERHLHLPLVIEDLAEELGLSPGRTAHLVKELTSQTWLELLTRARITASIELLLHTDLTVAEIAGRCGFNEQSTFQRAFRKWMGATPGRFRDDPEANVENGA